MALKRICMTVLGHLCIGIISLVVAQVNQASFSSVDIATYERLVAIAVERDSAVLQARVELQQAQLNESLAGLLSQAVSIDMAVGTSTTTFEQAKPNYSASLNLDVTKLLAPRVSTVEAKQAALDAQVRQLRVRVMQAFTNYKVALVAAQNAASVVESRLKQFGDQQASGEGWGARAGRVVTGTGCRKRRPGGALQGQRGFAGNQTATRPGGRRRAGRPERTAER